MSLIKFLEDETIMDLEVNLEGHRVTLTSQAPITAIATLINQGMLLLNEHNQKVMSDFSEYKYLCHEDNEQYQYVISDDPNDIWEEPYYCPAPTLDDIKAIKISEMEGMMNMNISNGVTVDLRDGTRGIFSLSIQDQMALTTLRLMAEKAEDKDTPSIPWHTSDPSTGCRYFAPVDIIAITDAATEHITYHSALFRDLRAYVNSIFNEEDIWKVEYDISSLPSEARSKVLTDIMK